MGSVLLMTHKNRMELCFSYTFMYLREDQDDKYLCSDEAHTHSAVFKLHMLKSLDKGSELMKYAWFLVLLLQ